MEQGVVPTRVVEEDQELPTKDISLNRHKRPITAPTTAQAPRSLTQESHGPHHKTSTEHSRTGGEGREEAQETNTKEEK